MDKLIIDLPDGERCCFYIDNDNRLIRKCGKVSKAVMEGAAGSFDGVFDVSGIFYIAASNSDGGIDCLILDGDSEKHIPLVSGKSGVSRISGIRLLCTDGMFSLWYCLEYESNLLLVNQLFDSRGKADAPFAVDRLGSRRCFSVCCDSEFSTNVFYRDKDGISRYLRYSRIFEKFEPGDAGLFCSDDVVSVSSICDEERLHLAFVAKRSDYYGVYYKNSALAREAVLGFGVGAGCTTAVCSDGKNVRVYWADNYECCECLSTDGGATFGKPLRISHPGDRAVLCGYRSSGNNSGLYANACIYREDSENIVHGNELLKYVSKNADKITDMREEIKDYAEKNAAELKVGIDFAARLESIETQLMKIVYILEELSYGKNNIKSDNGGNDIETV